MGLNIETAKNYAGSVLERTFGINAYKRFVKNAEKAEHSSGVYQNRKMMGVITAGGMQFILPATTEALAGSWSKSKFGNGEETNMNHFVQFAKYTSISMLDGVTWMLLGNTDNLAEFALYKLALNAATQVALDLGGEAVKRLKSFRPSAPTLLA